MVNGNLGEPQEDTVVPEDHLEFETSPERAPVHFENIKDNDGQQVTKVTRKTLVTKHVTKDGVKTKVSEPIEDDTPLFVAKEPDSSVSKYLNWCCKKNVCG